MSQVLWFARLKASWLDESDLRWWLADVRNTRQLARRTNWVYILALPRPKTTRRNSIWIVSLISYISARDLNKYMSKNADLGIRSRARCPQCKQAYSRPRSTYTQTRSPRRVGFCGLVPSPRWLAVFSTTLIASTTRGKPASALAWHSRDG